MDAPRAAECLTLDKLITLDNGDVVATVDAHPDLCRSDGSPAQLGDVLSVQPDGTLQTRPAGMTGSYERARVSGSWLVFRPLGLDGQAFCVPLAGDWPS